MKASLVRALAPLMVSLTSTAAGEPAPRAPVAIRGLVQPVYTLSLGEPPPGAGRHDVQLSFAGLQLDATPRDAMHAAMLVDFSRGRLTLLDAFAEVRLHAWLTLRVGKAAVPISEERATPRVLLPWVAPSPASWLSPARGIGAFAYGEAPGGGAHWDFALIATGAPGGLVDVDPDAGRDLVARIYVHPLRGLHETIAGLGLGVGASVGTHRGTASLPQTMVVRSYGNEPVFAYRGDGTPAGTTVAGGCVVRIAPHLTWSHGRFAAFAEHVHQRERVGGTTVASNATSATVSVVLTGEVAAPLRRVRVAHPFDASAGHVGAVQLVVGGGRLHIGDAAFPALADPAVAMQQAIVVGAGLNWYPTDGVGLLIDYAHTTFAAADGATPRRAEDALIVGAEMQL